MKTQSDRQLESYERIGQYFLIHFNEEVGEGDEGQPTYTYDTAKVPLLATRDERIEALIATRYTIQQEFAAINNGGGRYDDYLAFRAQCKEVADLCPNLG